MASVEVAEISPAATFVIIRSLFLEPTLTVFARSATAPLPIATVFSASAIAPAPIAYVLSKFAFAPLPKAKEFLPLT